MPLVVLHRRSGRLIRFGLEATGAVDSLLSAKPGAAAGKRFLEKTLSSPDHPQPKVIKLDGNPSYPPFPN